MRVEEDRYIRPSVRPPKIDCVMQGWIDEAGHTSHMTAARSCMRHNDLDEPYPLVSEIFVTSSGEAILRPIPRSLHWPPRNLRTEALKFVGLAGVKVEFVKKAESAVLTAEAVVVL